MTDSPRQSDTTPITDNPAKADALRHKLIAELFCLRVWHRGKDRVVTPSWHTLTVDERDLIAEALRQWRSA